MGQDLVHPYIQSTTVLCDSVVLLLFLSFSFTADERFTSFAHLFCLSVLLLESTVADPADGLRGSNPLFLNLLARLVSSHQPALEC